MTEPHPTLLRRGVLLCEDAAPERVIAVPVDTGICPEHRNTACALWYVPWPDTGRPVAHTEKGERR